MVNILPMSDSQLTFDAMCKMLMSITDESLLGDIERDCTSISNAMISFPIAIPGTRYYKGIKVRKIGSSREVYKGYNCLVFGQAMPPGKMMINRTPGCKN